MSLALKFSILIVGPLPPPHTGNSLPILKLINSWESQGFIIKAINVSSTSLSSGNLSLKKILFWFKIYFYLIFKKGSYDFIYLSIAESIYGNLRDLIFYALLGKSRSILIVHLFGGFNLKKIVQSQGLLGIINRYYLSSVLRIVVESEYQKSFFSLLVQRDKVQIVENFAEDELFIKREQIFHKFQNPPKLKIIFLSNLLYGKGHLELLDAFLSLNVNVRKKFELHFAGNLVHDPQNNFLVRVNNSNDIYFHGFLNGDKKRDLLFESHIFCMPTYYPFEGLPFSIIESYASGCVSILTQHSGIPFIFTDKFNGFQIQKQNIQSIVEVLETISIQVKDGYDFLIDKALFNYEQALKRNRLSQFIESFNSIIRK